MDKYKIENKIASSILDQAFKIHNELGPGLLESVYERCIKYELEQIGHNVQTQVPVPLTYKSLQFETGFKIDLLVDNLVLIELKAIEALAPIHFAQTLTYLKITKLKLGLLINFNNKFLKDGIHRVVNNL